MVRILPVGDDLGASTRPDLEDAQRLGQAHRLCRTGRGNGSFPCSPCRSGQGLPTVYISIAGLIGRKRLWMSLYHISNKRQQFTTKIKRS